MHRKLNAWSRKEEMEALERIMIDLLTFSRSTAKMTRAKTLRFPKGCDG